MADREPAAGHTPGPWEVRDNWYIHVAKPGSWSHAEVKCCPGVPAENGEEHKANARLIAASPTMFDYIATRAKEGDKRAATILDSIRLG